MKQPLVDRCSLCCTSHSIHRNTRTRVTFPSCYQPSSSVLHVFIFYNMFPCCGGKTFILLYRADMRCGFWHLCWLEDFFMSDCYQTAPWCELFCSKGGCRSVMRIVWIRCCSHCCTLGQAWCLQTIIFPVFFLGAGMLECRKVLSCGSSFVPFLWTSGNGCSEER